MQIHIQGIVSGDTYKHKLMTEIYNNCKKLCIALPDPVYKYFSDDEPAEEGVKINLEQHVKNIESKYEEIFQLDIKEIIKEYPDLTHIRFVHSY